MLKIDSESEREIGRDEISVADLFNDGDVKLLLRLQLAYIIFINSL